MSYNDISPSSIGINNDELPIECKKYLDEHLPTLTVKELRAISNYVSDRAYQLERQLTDSISMEDFDKVKKDLPDEDDYEEND